MQISAPFSAWGRPNVEMVDQYSTVGKREMDIRDKHMHAYGIMLPLETDAIR